MIGLRKSLLSLFILFLFSKRFIFLFIIFLFLKYNIESQKINTWKSNINNERERLMTAFWLHIYDFNTQIIKIRNKWFLETASSFNCLSEGWEIIYIIIFISLSGYAYSFKKTGKKFTWSSWSVLFSQEDQYFRFSLNIRVLCQIFCLLS